MGSRYLSLGDDNGPHLVYHILPAGFQQHGGINHTHRLSCGETLVTASSTLTLATAWGHGRLHVTSTLWPLPSSRPLTLSHSQIHLLSSQLRDNWPHNICEDLQLLLGRGTESGQRLASLRRWGLGADEQKQTSCARFGNRGFRRLAVAEELLKRCACLPCCRTPGYPGSSY